MRVGHGEGRLKIAVLDNGVGIPAENLIRIFNHGSPRARTATASACTAARWPRRKWAESLNVQSDGVGCGATFHVGPARNRPSGDYG